MDKVLALFQLAVDTLGPDLLIALKESGGGGDASITMTGKGTKDGETHEFTFMLMVEPVVAEPVDEEPLMLGFDPPVFDQDCDCDFCRQYKKPN